MRIAVGSDERAHVTDAVVEHLQQKGIDAGWQVVAPGQSWQGVVELVLDTR